MTAALLSLLGMLVLLAVNVTSATAAPPAVAITSAVATGPNQIEVSGTVDTFGEAATIYAERATSSVGPFEFFVIDEIPTGTSGPTNVSGFLNGLEAETEYFVRLDAETSANGETYSPEPYPSVTTLPPAPVVILSRASYVGTNTATVTATLDTENEATTYRVEYGPTIAYGSSTPISTPLSPSPRQQDVSATIPELQPSTLYHWRFVASNPTGTTNGPDHTFSTFPNRAAGPCPTNEAFRTGPSAALPDCRAYEQVSPVDKNGSNIQHEVGVVQAASGGGVLAFALASGLPATGQSGGSRANYFSRRNADGWTTNSVTPITEPGVRANLDGWDENLSTSIGEAKGPIFLGDLEMGTYENVIPSSSPIETEQPVPDFASDPKHFLIETKKPLDTSAVTGVANLYEVDHGSVALAGVVPAGAATSCSTTCVPAAAGSFAGPYAWQAGNLESGGGSAFYYTENTISSDGSRIVFTTRGDGKLYLREDGTTTWISASQRSTPDPNGPQPAAFVGASADDSKIYFLSCEQLTEDSTAHSTAADDCTAAEAGQDLYVYEPGEVPGEGELTDLTVDTNVADPVGADVVGFLGASADGGFIYFAANGLLAQGGSQGNCPTIVTTIPKGFSCNIYVLAHGVVRFVTSIDPGAAYSIERQYGGQENWLARQPNNYGQGAKTSRVSANGTLLFDSTANLKGYDPSCSLAEGVCAELYRYTPSGEALNCVSCNPSGAPPVGNATLVRKGKVFAASVLRVFATRNLSSDGKRVFFESPDPLSPADKNNVTDPYEWEAAGTGSCSMAEADGGCIYLLSSGEDNRPSFFGDASASGDDVFIFTGQQLVPSDRDALTDAYDVKVDGGLAQQQVSPPIPCSGEPCKAPPAVSEAESSPGSSVFKGPGNKPSEPQRCKKQGKPKAGKAAARKAKSAKPGCGKTKKHKGQQKKKHKGQQNRSQGVRPSENEKRGGSN